MRGKFQGTINLFIIIFSLLVESINAQSYSNTGSPFIQNYTTKEYKASSQNYTIVQDKRGIMYFGNTNGILEYDGKNWRLIEVSNNSLVRSLAIDSNGIIYVGALSEFGYLACNQSGQLKYVSLMNKLDQADRNFNDVWKICVTTHGIYFLTINKIFHYHNDTINVIPVELISDYGFIFNDKLFIIQKDKGLFAVNSHFEKEQGYEYSLQLLPYSKKFTEKPERLFIIPYSNLSTITEANADSKILVCDSRNGLFIYDISKLYFEKSTSFDNFGKKDFTSTVKKFHTEIDEYIYYNIISACTKINNNRYAFSTYNGGIVIINKDGKLEQIINKNRGLQSNCVYNIFTDNNNNLWASLEKGISYIEISSPITKFNEADGLEGYILSTIRHNERIYVGTSKGIYYLPKYKMSIVNDMHNFMPVNNAKSVCWDFYSIKNILLASSNHGVVLIQDTLAIPLNNIGNIYCFGHSDKFPEYIFLGLTNGFTYIEMKCSSVEQNKNNITDKISFINHGKFKDINEPIKKIISDNNGDLWLTTLYNGIINIKFNEDNISDYQIVHYDTAHGLPQLNYNYVHFINNRLIVATQKGIYKAIMSSESAFDTHIKFIPDVSFGEMFCNDSIIVTQIYVNDKNKIYINSGLGIGTLLKDHDSYYVFNNIPFKKIPSNYKFYIDQKEIVWVSTSEGLFRYDPKTEKKYNLQFNALIRKTTINNDSVIFYGTNYKDSLFYNGTFYEFSTIQPQYLIPVLSYENNSISFEFAATFYENDLENKFKYILEGYNKDWSKWTTENKKEYTNLPEGTYKFRVKAKNIFETESNEAIYEFTILPPWYRTVLAYILFVVFFMTLSYIVVSKLIFVKNKVVQKYLSSPLSEDKVTDLFAEIIELFNDKKLFLKNDISLHQIAKLLDSNEKYISQAINMKHGTNFKNFVNEFRIKEAKKNLLDPKFKNFTIEGIAKEVGFKSRSAFNIVFKRITGFTPTEFKNKETKRM